MPKTECDAVCPELPLLTLCCPSSLLAPQFEEMYEQKRREVNKAFEKYEKQLKQAKTAGKDAKAKADKVGRWAGYGLLWGMGMAMAMGYGLWATGYLGLRGLLQTQGAAAWGTGCNFTSILSA